MIRIIPGRFPPRISKWRDYNPFEGMKVTGKASAVTVRGEVVARNGKFVGQKKRGEFLKRQPTHF